MSATIAIGNGKAKSGAAKNSTKSPRFGSTSIISAQISGVLKAIYSEKPWAYLAQFVGISPRSAKHKIYGTARYSDEEIASLLRSEHGRKILSVLMGEAKPRWYARLLEQDAIANARLHEHRARQLAATLAAADDLSATIARTETALAISDAEFFCTDIDGLREARGAGNSALAENAKGPKLK